MRPIEFDVLSVDWDYFLSCIDDYDWGHGEDRAIFFDIIWSFRAFERKFTDYGKEDATRAIDDVVVDLDELRAFVNDILTRDRLDFLLKLFVVESHGSIWNLLTSIREQVPNSICNVWNLDAHHDYLYSRTPEPGTEPDCATWAYQGKQEGLIGEYHLVYPGWRKENPEPGSGDKVPGYVDGLSYGFQNAPLPKSFQFAFFCRSSAWTPPWEDDKWMTLLREIELIVPRQWADKAFANYVLEPREFDRDAVYAEHLRQTERVRQHHQEMLEARGENSIGLPS